MSWQTLSRLARDPYTAHLRWRALAEDSQNQLLNYMTMQFGTAFTHRFQSYASREGYRPPALVSIGGATEAWLSAHGFVASPLRRGVWVHPSGQEVIPDTRSPNPSSATPSKRTIPPDGENAAAVDNIERELSRYPALESRVTSFERNPDDKVLLDELFTDVNAHITSISQILENQDTDLSAADPEYRDELQRAEQEKERSSVLLKRLGDAWLRASAP